MKSYFLALRKFTDFDTRTNRTDYWMFTLFNTFFIFLALILDNLLNIQFANFIGPIRILYGVFIFLPSLAITVRRLHDTNRTGWNILLGIVPGIGTVYLFYLLAAKGDEEENDYLPDDQKESISLHESDQYRDAFLVLVLSYFLINSAYIFIANKYFNNFFQTYWYKVVGSIENLIWAFIPIGLALLIKSETKRIAMLIVTALLCLLSFYRTMEFLNMSIFNK